MEKKPLRKVEILEDILRHCPGGHGEYKFTAQWYAIQFKDLKKGHVYRMFDPDGEPVDGGEVCVALSDAAPTKEALESVKTLDGKPVKDGAENYFVQSLALLGF